MNTKYNFQENLDMYYANFGNIQIAKLSLKDSIYSFYHNRKELKEYCLNAMARYSFIMSILQLKMTIKLVNNLKGRVYYKMLEHYEYNKEMAKTVMKIYKTHCL